MQRSGRGRMKRLLALTLTSPSAPFPPPHAHAQHPSLLVESEEWERLQRVVAGLNPDLSLRSLPTARRSLFTPLAAFVG